MPETRTNRFLKYLPLLLDALRSADPAPMRPAEARAWIRAHTDVPAEDLTRRIKAKHQQTIFENDVHWARFYLVKAGLVASPKRGLWGLTPSGRSAQLTGDETWNLYVHVRDASRPGVAPDEDEVPAPELADDTEEEVAYWFVGAKWDDSDETRRFVQEGIWENGYTDGQYLELVNRMKAGDRVAIKASFVKKRGLPFDVGGKPVSVMRIKATGTILENLKDGRRIKVAWDPQLEDRDWYFYTYLVTVSEADAESESARRLIDFAFHGEPQEYGWFLQQPYWAGKYGFTSPGPVATAPTEETTALDVESPEVEQKPSYTVGSIADDGSFLAIEELGNILTRWRSKKNLVLQGPPGTGKTWLAKRLGFALIGSDDRETAKSRLRVVQFHPSLAYEDFVRGWRPAGEGRLSLVDGILMQAIEAASSEPDRPFVLVIEEINRGNPAQIFGEMLTLLEDSKRHRSEAIELAYRKEPGERTHVPENLYIIGTMNVADRSLAIVDLALRRRFAFVDLTPRFGNSWREWCKRRGVDEATLHHMEDRIRVLNEEISSSTTLGPQFQIGHSYLTPHKEERVENSREWFRARVETEIAPLLDEYWYDNPKKAKEEQSKLLKGLV